ncbi:PQQ-dependent sugar dehydrogenase [Ornithinimicrobium sp. F0845]|uniref:PQQ-dependent sugar dehydrogenase n=1 Tax=Ornithinimicrobium sp. F0845 TaxID=2926412 RepID=UPI001FF167C4|nr:PQQ-dependent sugar dehydrogenase [Ornithinimicrobium sp. F0845]MCK0112407.1 PQQ-dependent sugar dehydrogenase [Ornithinimicrobium sp. F0845]
MRRRVRPAIAMTAVVLLAGCSAGTDPDPGRLPSAPAHSSEPAAPPTPPSDPEPSITSASVVPPSSDEAISTPPAPSAPDPDPQTVATGFQVPWGLVPLVDGSLLIGERDTARVFRVVPGSDPELLTTVPGVQPGGEGGLLGLAVPADSPWHGGATGSFYAYATTADDNRVLLVDPAQNGGEPSMEVVLDGIPKAGNHNGGRIAFGPDGNLFVTTGDASEGQSSQDPDSLAGKILRVTPDGTPAPGNPNPESPVWSMGHRNVQGLGWDADGRLWASEFGQNALDEVNLIVPGGNYGWPEVEGPGGEPEFIDPVVSWPTENASPSGLAVGPDGDLYVAALRGESLWRVPVEPQTPGTDPASVSVGEPERLLEGEFGRLRSVVAGAGGELWVLTSNTFRGEPAPDDDRLLLLADPAELR